MASPFKLSNVAENDFIVVMCPRNARDKYCFRVPGVTSYGVWVARVKEIRRIGRTYFMKGWFFKNNSHDLTQDLLQDDDTSDIDFEEVSVVGIYEYEDDFAFDEDNVNDIKGNIEKVAS